MAQLKIVKADEVQPQNIRGFGKAAEQVRRLIATEKLFFDVDDVSPGFSPHHRHTHGKYRADGVEAEYPADFDEIYFILRGGGVIDRKRRGGRAGGATRRYDPHAAGRAGASTAQQRAREDPPRGDRRGAAAAHADLAISRARRFAHPHRGAAPRQPDGRVRVAQGPLCGVRAVRLGHTISCAKNTQLIQSKGDTHGAARASAHIRLPDGA